MQADPPEHPEGTVSQTLFGAPEGQDARVLAGLARDLMREDKVLVHVALDDTRLAALEELLGFFAPDVHKVVFPAWDCLPYDRVSPHNEVVARRVAALSTMLSWDADKTRHPRIVLTTVNALTQNVTPRDVLKNASFSARKDGTVEMADLQAFLHNNGYTRSETVREPGEYAIRGGIVDLFPPGYDDPLRIDLFGTEVESIRAFDPVSQRTSKKLSSFNLYPATEFFLDDDSIARFRAAYRDLFGVARSDDPLYEAVSAGRRYNGMDHWLPLFFETMDTLLDYAPGAKLVFDAHAFQAREERMAQVEDFYQARKTMQEQALQKKKGQRASLSGTIYHPLPVERLYLDEPHWQEIKQTAQIFSPFGAPEGDHEDCGGRKGRDFADIRALPDGDVFKALADHVAKQRQDGRKILIAAYSKGSRERLRSMLDHAGFANFKDVDAPEDLKKLDGRDLGLAILALEHGFTAPDLAVMTEQDILGDRLARRTRKSRKADNFLTEVSSLAPGDLVVHVDHGIGRFDSLETLEAAGKVHDFLKIIYAGDDRLYVPVENIEVLSRFGSEEGLTQLDRLGGAGWQARKARVKKDLMAMADHLLKIAAKRQLQKADSYHVGSDLYEEFASRFPYQETEDQQRSIAAVLEDLARPHPMDRLVCGDVGFGKTEVAMRAAYVAAMNGAQVAVIVPTTLLARQHFQNFAARFKGMGLRVQQLSRLVTQAEAKKIKEELADGSVNIIVGTHALFGKGIKFANLGLVVVDEEQRFGVKQKEKLKELKADVHVLTLTATPIPRTLQMSLTGVKEMSLIATPPVDRLAIRTFVLPYDPVVIREALLREHYRGGQSFYVCPRIKDLESVKEALQELVPEVKVIEAHGQMAPGDLEDRMTAFYDGQYDVLLATNIIESGIDIPTANTMVVHRADMFGLAQLYQIRGRIGRSKQRAYAYLTYDPGKKLTDQGQKRLEVIETLDTLGSGFQLASHDMDIRGAGNLLGEEQSGHIKEVGVELYQQMLEEAVAMAREGLDWNTEESNERWSPQINIGTSVLIPDHYVEDLNVRMSLYRRLSELEAKEDIDSFAAELIDRFGDLPEEVENLLDIVAIKQLCRRAGIGQIDAGPKGAVMTFHKDSPPNVEGLMRWMQEKGGALKLRPDQKLVAIRQWQNTAQRVKGVQSLMTELAGLNPLSP
ncbi:MAG: transcription-repair coupling factor [Rhodospirillales bacterium]|nr:transcription-repair coupling factor [Rhodospirillales bacterium]MCB9996057.1 transcription-repair coupling factor [Rhodospirillales bacterium]